MIEPAKSRRPQIGRGYDTDLLSPRLLTIPLLSPSNMATQKANKYVYCHYGLLPILCSPSRSSSFARRKAFAIKHQEAEPLTRRDLQYDFLYHIFAAPERVFTDPTLASSKEDDDRGGSAGGGVGSRTVTFRDLYVHALMSSPRCSKALREKMQETPEFATDFAKMSLLANVGRVNTTMTCLRSRFV